VPSRGDLRLGLHDNFVLLFVFGVAVMLKEPVDISLFLFWSALVVDCLPVKLSSTFFSVKIRSLSIMRIFIISSSMQVMMHFSLGSLHASFAHSMVVSMKVYGTWRCHAIQRSFRYQHFTCILAVCGGQNWKMKPSLRNILLTAYKS